jgi:hypothetical protein
VSSTKLGSHINARSCGHARVEGRAVCRHPRGGTARVGLGLGLGFGCPVSDERVLQLKRNGGLCCIKAQRALLTLRSDQRTLMWTRACVEGRAVCRHPRGGTARVPPGRASVRHLHRRPRAVRPPPGGKPAPAAGHIGGQGKQRPLRLQTMSRVVRMFSYLDGVRA